MLLCEDSGALSIWASNDDVWKTWTELITVAEHDDAALGVDCLDSGKEYVTVGADGNIKVCKFLTNNILYPTYNIPKVWHLYFLYSSSPIMNYCAENTILKKKGCYNYYFYKIITLFYENVCIYIGICLWHQVKRSHSTSPLEVAHQINFVNRAIRAIILHCFVHVYNDY